jgi:hypothetical protein
VRACVEPSPEQEACLAETARAQQIGYAIHTKRPLARLARVAVSGQVKPFRNLKIALQ